MLITRFMAIPLIGILLILGACGSPAPTTPTAAPAPSPTTPTPTPAPSQPAPMQTQPAPNQTAPMQGGGQTAFTDGAFTISDLRIEFDGGMGMAEPGDDVTVVVKVTNTGGQPGTYTLVLKVDGTTVKTQDVTLAGGATQTVNLTITAGKIGNYTISIGQLTRKLEVMAH